LQINEAGMKRQTPPLDSIEAFLQAAQAKSFREAADALAISPSAFSRRLQALEAFLGTSLFDRTGPRPQLNESGRLYLRAVAPALESIRRASLRPDALGTGVLRVMAPHSFAIAWLVQRLPSFLSEDGGTPVELVVSRDLTPLKLGSADLGIVSGPRDWEGLDASLLASLSGLLVSAPLLVYGAAAPRCVGDLREHERLGVTWPQDMWAAWLAGVAYCGPALRAARLYDTASLTYEAAAAGLGVTLAAPFLADRLLQSGRLQVVPKSLAPLGVDYYLVSASRAVSRRADVQAFAAWIRAHSDASIRSFEALA
jgi:LysR family transcriptional regulator, glycine cleavage system transcriptional activator